jgi:hypothetical protein
MNDGMHRRHRNNCGQSLLWIFVRGGADYSVFCCIAGGGGLGQGGVEVGVSEEGGSGLPSPSP